MAFRPRFLALRIALAAAAVWALQAFACSAADQQTAAGSGGKVGAGGAPSTSSSTGPGGFDAGTGGSTGSTGIGGACAEKTSAADPVPLDIFVMLDQSGSMNLDAGNGMSRWQAIKAAMTAFVQQPNVAGIGMGIQFFGLPLPDVSGCTTQTCTTDGDCMNGCTTCGPEGVCHSSYNPDADTCDPVEYAWAEVPIQPLPGVGNAIISAIGMHAPGTNTPTGPALQGAIDYAAKWAKANPTHITVIALATDGEPGECDAGIPEVDAIAAAGVAGTPSLRTFVIGVGPSLSALDGIAAAGGTGAAYHVDMNTMATQQLVQFLNTIRGAAIACTYQIPPPPPGKMEDFSLVNVEYLPGKGPPKVAIPKVTGKAACPSSGDAWYYDDETKPTEIILCPATCDAISQDAKAEVSVVFGCKTILK